MPKNVETANCPPLSGAAPKPGYGRDMEGRTWAQLLKTGPPVEKSLGKAR